MSKIWVCATGTPVPYEGDPQRTIGDTAVEVPRNAYYLRRVRDGELREVEAPAAPKSGNGKVN